MSCLPVVVKANRYLTSQESMLNRFFHPMEKQWFIVKFQADILPTLNGDSIAAFMRFQLRVIRKKASQHLLQKMVLPPILAVAINISI